MFGAQERTEAEYRALLQAAGLGRVADHPTDTPDSGVEAVRPEAPDRRPFGLAAKRRQGFADTP